MSGDAAKALKYAFKLLGYRGRSENELSERLRQKGFGPEVVESVVRRLKDGGYIDDGALALSLRRRAEEVKLLGQRGAGMYLRAMGIPAEMTREAIRDYDEVSSAMRLVESRRRALAGLPRAVAVRRMSGQLRRRGYSPEAARKALEALDGKKTET